MTDLNNRILGIDLGGTKSAAVIGTKSGEILARVSAATPTGQNARGLTKFLVTLAREVFMQSAESVIGCGISAGAPAHAAKGLVYDAPNLHGFGAKGFPLASALSEALGGISTFLENDADATALAEHHFGAGKGTRTMAFLTIGTGIGAGLILDGRLHRGAKGAGGEIGHIAVVPDGDQCNCGLRGCLEAYASGPSLVRQAQKKGYDGILTGQAVVAAAREGNDAARFAVAQAGKMLGRGLATLTMLLNPERIVLGTLAVHAGDLLLPIVRAEFTRCSWPRLANVVTIVPAALGDRAQDLAAFCAFLHNTDTP